MDLVVEMNAEINNEGVTVFLQAQKDSTVIDSAVRKYATGVLLGRDAKLREDDFSYQIEPKKTVGLLTPDGLLVSHRLQMCRALEWPDEMIEEFKAIAAKVHGGTENER